MAVAVAVATVLHRHPGQYFHESRLTRYLLYFRDVAPSYIVAKPTFGLCDSTLGFRMMMMMMVMMVMIMLMMMMMMMMMMVVD